MFSLVSLLDSVYYYLDLKNSSKIGDLDGLSLRKTHNVAQPVIRPRSAEDNPRCLGRDVKKNVNGTALSVTEMSLPVISPSLELKRKDREKDKPEASKDEKVEASKDEKVEASKEKALKGEQEKTNVKKDVLEFPHVYSLYPSQDWPVLNQLISRSQKGEGAASFRLFQIFLCSEGDRESGHFLAHFYLSRAEKQGNPSAKLASDVMKILEGKIDSFLAYPHFYIVVACLDPNATHRDLILKRDAINGYLSKLAYCKKN